MNTRTISVLAIGLWAATAAAGAYFFVNGNTQKASDGRNAIVLSPADRDLVLTEMRILLQTVQGVTEGVQRGDKKMIEEAATQGGTVAMVDSNAELMMRLPLQFKKIGVSVHEGFDEIAEAAKQGKSDAEILGLLNKNLGTCVACHAGYQIQLAE